jgi:hypothetical protein
MGLCSSFWDVPFCVTCFDQIETKPILNQNWRTHYGKFERRREICFNNKTILGALSLRYDCSSFGGAVALFAIFAQDILKVGPRVWCFESTRLLALLMLIISAYIPFTKMRV